MTRIEQIKAQIEAGGEGCVPYGSITELIALVEEMVGALEEIVEVNDGTRTVSYVCQSCSPMHRGRKALAAYKAFNEVKDD